MEGFVVRAPGMRGGRRGGGEAPSVRVDGFPVRVGYSRPRRNGSYHSTPQYRIHDMYMYVVMVCVSLFLFLSLSLSHTHTHALSLSLSFSLSLSLSACMDVRMYAWTQVRVGG